MENKNVMQAKKELIQFLKKYNAVAVYYWTVYGHELNSRNIRTTLTSIMYETRPKELCRLYEGLIGRLRSNPNIKDKEYWNNDTLYHVYKNWCEHVRNKFHIQDESRKNR